MPVSKEPPLISIAIMEQFRSYKLISQSEEFAVNIPMQAMKSEIYYCG